MPSLPAPPQTCHSERSRPTFSYAFAPANASACAVEESLCLFDRVATRNRNARQNRGKIKAGMPHEFTEGPDDLQPQPGSSRSGEPPRKSTLVDVLNPQNCPRCGQRFPSKIEESAMRKTCARTPAEWEKLREKISCRVCTCLEPPNT